MNYEVEFLGRSNGILTLSNEDKVKVNMVENLERGFSISAKIVCRMGNNVGCLKFEDNGFKKRYEYFQQAL